MKKTTVAHPKTAKETRSAYRTASRRAATGTGKVESPVDVAIPAVVVEAVRQMAQQLNLSLSEIYVAALTEYVAAHQGEDITAQLNRVYAAESSELDPALMRVQIATLAGESW